MRLSIRRSGGVGVERMPGLSGRNLSGSGVCWRERERLELDTARRGATPAKRPTKADAAHAGHASRTGHAGCLPMLLVLLSVRDAAVFMA